MKLDEMKGMLTNALPIIASYAPTISRAIGGPFGVAISYIIPVLANAFGIEPDNIESLGTAISTDEAAPDKLRKIEKDHAECLIELMHGLTELSSLKINIEINWK